MKLNLELVESRAKSAMPQAKDPRDASKKAPWTKGDGTKANFGVKKPERAKLAQPEYKAMMKFSSKGKPLEPGNVQPGKPEKAPSSAKFGGGMPNKLESMKSVKKPEAPKVKASKAAIPDADSVKSRGLIVADAGAATLDFKAKVGKVAGPMSAKKIDVANAKIVKPDLGWGLLKAGSAMDKLGNVSVSMQKVKAPAKPDVKPSKAALPQVKESAFNGQVILSIAGRRKMVFEAATPRMIAAIARDYARAGVTVELQPIVRGRSIYSDKEFSTLMLEAAHADHHMVDSSRVRRAALKRLAKMVEGEYNPRVHKNRKAWIKEAVMSAFRQSRHEFAAAYQNLLERFDVMVNTSSGSKKYAVMATDDQHAAALAVDRAMTSDIRSTVTAAYVGGRKFLPEGKGGSMFMRFPKPFAELVNGMKQTKSEMGFKSSMKVGKVPELKIGGSQPKGVVKIKQGDAGGEKSSLVDRDGSKFKLGKPLSMGDKPKDSGPVYEARERVVEDISKKVMGLIKAAAAMADGSEKDALEELAEKVHSNEEVSGKDSKVLDAFIKIAINGSLKESATKKK